jgi:hypothetical protein
MSQLGRISGPLLQANLLRDGTNLDFRNGPTDDELLLLEVNNNRIGVNSSSPTRDLDVDGKTFVSNNFIAAGTTATLGNIVINSSGTISSTVGPINIAPTGADAYVEFGDISNADVRIKDNYIQATQTDADLQFDSAGSGNISILNNTEIQGNLEVSQNISATGNVNLAGQFIIGDSPIDTVTINPDFTQSLVPGADNTYDLGSSLNAWRTAYLNGSLNLDSTSITELIISDQISFSGNTITTIQSNDVLSINPNTGITELEDLLVEENTITNTLDSVMTISSTGIGYLKFADSNAVAIPVGNNSERPFTEVGETRWNTEVGYLECFDGTIYQVATGGGVVVTPAFMQELGELYSLILG